MTSNSASSSDSAAGADFQSDLLRICIICASSIQSLGEPIQPNVISADATSLPPLASQLYEQLTSDLFQLLTLVQKHTNALSLALRPSSKTLTASPQSVDPQTFSPISGLDSASLTAAKAQLVTLANDVIPKLVFIAKKAWKDRAVYQADPRLAAEKQRQSAQGRSQLEAMAKAMGGMVMTSEQLGISSESSFDPSGLHKLIAQSLGEAFAKEVKYAVNDVLGVIAELFHSFLDAKSRMVMQKASKARDRADGIVSSSASDKLNTAAATPATLQEARKASLAANNLVWETCTKYICSEDGSAATVVQISPSGEKVRIQIKGLAKNNLEACKSIWQRQAELMRDGLQEMNEPEKLDHGSEDEDQDDELMDMPFHSASQRQVISQLCDLIKIGNLVHENVLKAVVSAAQKSANHQLDVVDLDTVEQLAHQFEVAQEELVAASLYEDFYAGLSELEMEQRVANTDQDEILGYDGCVQSAVLRTLSQYGEAAVNLYAYVSGREQLLKQVQTIISEKTDGQEFDILFQTRFSQLCKVFSQASVDIQVRTTAPTSDDSALTNDDSAPTNNDSAPITPASTALSEVNYGFKVETFVKQLQQTAQNLGPNVNVTDRAVAEQLDKADPLSSLRDAYILPKVKDVCDPTQIKIDGTKGQPDASALYMCGNSLGPLAKLTKTLLNEELDAWGRKAVLAHFDHPYQRPWTQLEKRVSELSADIVGAKLSEVTVMSTLTANLHTMLNTFYRPAVKPFGVGFKGDVETAKREGLKLKHKIVYEYKAFPSDQFALASTIQLNGFDPATSLVPLKPKEPSRTLETADILATIEQLGKEGETCMVLIGGVQYFTGQFFELEKLAAKAREYGILFGVDLAHAFANVPLRLHDWGVDFAVWCTYKYGSSGPGGIAGLFVHEKWTSDAQNRLDRPAGWWGHDRATRFSMPEDFDPIDGADGWQVSNPSMLDVISLQGSLETLQHATTLVAPRSVQKQPVDGQGRKETDELVGEGTIMPILRSKSLELTAYLEMLLLTPGFLPRGLGIRVITPRDPHQRGTQLCIQIPDLGSKPSQAPPTDKDKSPKTDDGDLPPPIDSSRLIARAHSRAEKMRGLVTDIRHPDCLRIAPLAQFSTFTEVWRTVEALRLSIEEELELQA